ncbi:MAG: pyridoxal-phosphate dependent enzyme, partial [Hyphomicrobiaceae bacterium]
MTSVIEKVLAHPRAPLLSAPTPVEHLRRLSGVLGVGLYVKRDDLTGLGMGGNKVRQLEFYFGAALAQRADTVLITGAVQSNYVRTAAAAAAKLGLQAVLQLEERVPGMGPLHYSSGNVLLDDLLGARRISYPEGEDEAGADASLRAEAQRLRDGGRVPYVIPLGLDNPPLGALGYVLAAHELVQGGFDFDAVVVASGSGLTHAGLLAGLRALGVDVPVYGICVRRAAGLQSDRIRTVCGKLADLIGRAPVVRDSDIVT